MPAHDHPLLGKWRIVEMELWDADFLDLLEPAYIAFDQQGRGEFVFGAVRGGLDCRYGPDSTEPHRAPDTLPPRVRKAAQLVNA